MNTESADNLKQAADDAHRALGTASDALASASLAVAAWEAWAADARKIAVRSGPGDVPDDAGYSWARRSATELSAMMRQLDELRDHLDNAGIGPDARLRRSETATSSPDSPGSCPPQASTGQPGSCSVLNFPELGL